MPPTPSAIVVDPDGRTVTVDITHHEGDVSERPTVYSQDEGSTELDLPLEISETTEFWVTTPGTYEVSTLWDGREIAGGTPDEGETVTRRVARGMRWKITPQVEPGELATGVLSVASDTAGLFLNHADFHNSIGEVDKSTLVRHVVWNLPPTGVTAVSATFRTPSTWATANVTVWGYYASGGGVARINPDIRMAAAGEAYNQAAVPGLTSTLDITFGTANEMFAVAAGTFTCDPAKIGAFTIQRNGDSGADTAGNFFPLLGVMLTKAS